MGKSLIIKGADFSVNGIAPAFRRLAWIGGSTKNGSDQDTPQGQYINSGVLSAINVKLVVEFEIAAGAIRNAYLSGCGVSNQTNLFAWAQETRIAVYMGYAEGTDANALFIPVNPRDGKKHTIEISKGGVVYDGVTYSWDITPSSSGATAPIYLDCCSKYTPDYNTKVANAGDTKIHNVKIYTDYQDESSLAVDAIPVKRISDDVVCFYNAVNGEYLERNNGSTPEYE